MELADLGNGQTGLLSKPILLRDDALNEALEWIRLHSIPNFLIMNETRNKSNFDRAVSLSSSITDHHECPRAPVDPQGNLPRASVPEDKPELDQQIQAIQRFWDPRLANHRGPPRPPRRAPSSAPIITTLPFHPNHLQLETHQCWTLPAHGTSLQRTT